MALEFIREKNENITDYMIRLYENKMQYGLSNQEIADLLNKEEDAEFDESRWRKIYQAWENYFSEYVTEKFNDAGEYNKHILDKYELARIELDEKKTQFRDQRREYEKMKRESGRFNHLAELLVENVSAFEPKGLPLKQADLDTDKELLVLLNDMHIGMTIDNRFNTYDINIAQERLNKIKQRVHKTIVKENIEILHIANLGDAIHGTIHASAKLQSEEDVIQQIIKASEFLADFIKTFLDLGIKVKYYNIVGNHGRVTASKHEITGAEENFEKLILTILDASLKRYDNYESEGCLDGFIEATIGGQDVILTHGNFDNHNNSAYRLPQLIGRIPQLIVSGHVHHMLQKDFGTTLVEVSPSLSGLDDYASSGRFAGKAGQKMIMFEDEEIASTSTIYVS